MTKRQLGIYRDNEILERIEVHKCLNTEQIQILMFKGMTLGSRKRKCQQRLKKLTDQGKIRRWRYDLESPYAYFIERIGHMEHAVLLNWIVIWSELNLNSCEEIYSIKYEKDFGILRSDCFIAIKNTVTDSFRFLLIEMDIHHASNKFNKVKKYNKLYESDLSDQWWSKLTDKFPKILLVTNIERKLNKIVDLVKSENKNSLEFECHLVWNIRNDVLKSDELTKEEG